MPFPPIILPKNSFTHKDFEILNLFFVSLLYLLIFTLFNMVLQITLFIDTIDIKKYGRDIKIFLFAYGFFGRVTKNYRLIK